MNILLLSFINTHLSLSLYIYIYTCTQTMIC